MPESSTTQPGPAVFLSYAREDVEQARRIADALRAFGMEVWFDQAELRGGDAWDQKIRRQIRECALFMPLISARTQARGEGYFRREWNLGVERTRDMAHGVPFIVPVVVDDTPADEAMVPEEFLRYQWTQLKHGVPSSQFVEQVKGLLEAPKKVAGSRAPAPPAKVAAALAPAGHRSHTPLVILGCFAVLVAGGVAYLLLRPRRSPEEVARLVAAATTIASQATAAAEKADAGKEGAPPAAAPAVSDKSVAVLPFENMSEDKDTNAFFADGIHEDILTNLALVKGLRVVSRTSVMQYRGATKPIREIAKELGVAYILEGSVRRAGNKVRVTGQLIHAATDEHIWAKSYDRDITDIFAIQGELAQAIAGALSEAISPEERALLERRPTENADAYDLYLKARKMREDGYGSLAVTEPLLRAAVELDPRFAVGWAELGRLQANAFFADEDHTDARLAKAKEAIETAIRLAPDDPTVIENTGDYYYYGYRDYTRAAQQYLRLAQLKPNDPVMYYSLALIHRRQGHWADSLVNFRRAVELDPADLPHANQFLQFLFGTRHYDEGEALGRRITQAFPDRVLPAGFLAITEFLHTGATQGVESFLGQKFAPGDAELFVWTSKIDARMTGDLTEVLRLDREHPYVERVGYAHWQQDVDAAQDLWESGERDASRAKIDSVMPVMTAELARQPLNASLWESLAEAHAIKGEKDEAIRCSEKAMELIPESRDAVEGPGIALFHASVLAQVGEKDRALAEFTRLINVPYTGANVHVARNGIWFNASFRALRGDPKFEALLNDPANNAPVF